MRHFFLTLKGHFITNLCYYLHKQKGPRVDGAANYQSFLAPVASLFSSEEAAVLPETTTSTEYGVVANHHPSTKFHVPDAMSILAPQTAATNEQTISYQVGVGDSNLFSSPSSIYMSANEAETVNAILNQSSPNQDQQPTTTSTTSYATVDTLSSTNLMRPSSKSLIGSLVNHAAATASQPSQHHAVSCSHQNAGQELCYLCHQRQKRNVPVYLSEEVKRREKEEAQILSQYQHLMVIKSL